MFKKKDALESYKDAIKSKFNEEQLGLFSSFLQNPSRAKLRDFCVERLKNNPTLDDLQSFKLFTSFDFEQYTKSKMSKLTDKFRPIENFFQGKSDLVDLTSLEMAAILVDFKPRPFKKYAKLDMIPLNQKVDLLDANKQTPTELVKENSENKQPQKQSKLKKYALPLFVAFGILGATFTTNQLLFNLPQCMVWQNDKYVKIACEESSENFQGEVIPFDEKQFLLKKITVSDSTVFFKGNKPLYFYGKVNGKVEIFNQLGYHPLTGKYLKPVTPYIINKYVKKVE